MTNDSSGSTSGPRRSFVLFVLVAALSLTAACRNETVQEPRDLISPGVTDEEIRIGSSLALSGHAKFLGIQTLRGALAYIHHVNDQGGVHGRTIRFIHRDDAYDPPRCLVNTQRLIVDEQVFALSCYVGTPTTVKIIPLVNQAKIPLVGMFTGANALREPFNRYIINVRASYYQETGAAVRHLVEDLDLKRIAVFYQYDAYGFDGLTGAELALRQYGLAPIARGTYIRGTDKIEDGLRRILETTPDAVILIGTYEPCAAFIRQSREIGSNPVFYNVSFVGADELARRVENESDATILMSQVVPPPHDILPDAEGAKADYVSLLQRYFPGETPNVIGLEGFINARVLVEGLQRAGRNLTREKFIDAIDSMREFSLGRNLTVSFSPSDHQGLDRVYFTVLRQGAFRLITDWERIRGEIAAKPPVKRGKADLPVAEVAP